MDIANYLSELLGLHGEVNVPGLGYFVHRRVNGYYNDAEGKFYPPGYTIHFDPQTIEDNDTLAKYIAESKKISLASSKYFTEKYIAGLKTEVTLQDVPFANVGWFYMDKGRIAFRAEEKHADNISVFGYQPINIKKLSGEQGTSAVKTVTVILQPPPPLLPLPTAPTLPAQMPVQPQQVQPQEDFQQQPVVEQPEEYVEEEQEAKRGISVWVIVVIIAIILAAGAFGLYKYKPGLFDRRGEQIQQPDESKDAAKPVLKADTDTTKIVAPTIDTPAKAISKPDSTLNKTTVPAKADTVAKPVYVIFIGSFKTLTRGEIELAKYKKAGVDARIWSGPGTGKRIKIITGSFATSAEAETERTKLITSKKIGKDSYSQLLTNPQK
jgi:cell division protein FtsN